MLPLLLSCCLLTAPTSPTSDWTGIYGLVISAAVVPVAATGDAPGGSELHLDGIFALSKGPRSRDYHPARAGRLRFRLAGDDQDRLRLGEWHDLTKSARTGQILGFGVRGIQMPTIWPLGSEPGAADLYQLGHGVHRVADPTSPYDPIRSVTRLGFPEVPTTVEGQTHVTWIHFHPPTELRHRLELVLPDGTTIVGPTVPAAAGAGRWVVPVTLPPVVRSVRIVSVEGAEAFVAERLLATEATPR